ncbi:hypothetical protein JXD38_11370 [candidate division WOR-3 bacterium]|nr:hypothetical protein [candidate division WOR-3 bacterium]
MSDGDVLTRIGIASHHGGYELKLYLVRMQSQAGNEVVDFGNLRSDQDDDYPEREVL